MRMLRRSMTVAEQERSPFQLYNNSVRSLMFEFLEMSQENIQTKMSLLTFSYVFSFILSIHLRKVNKFY